MKRKQFRFLALILIVAMLSTTTQAVSTMYEDSSASSDYGSATADLLTHVSTEETQSTSSTCAVYGNTEMTEQEFRDVVNQGENKIYLHYRTDKDIYLS